MCNHCPPRNVVAARLHLRCADDHGGATKKYVKTVTHGREQQWQKDWEARGAAGSGNSDLTPIEANKVAQLFVPVRNTSAGDITFLTFLILPWQLRSMLRKRCRLQTNCRNSWHALSALSAMDVALSSMRCSPPCPSCRPTRPIGMVCSMTSKVA